MTLMRTSYRRSNDSIALDQAVDHDIDTLAAELEELSELVSRQPDLVETIETVDEQMGGDTDE